MSWPACLQVAASDTQYEALGNLLREAWSAAPAALVSSASSAIGLDLIQAAGGSQHAWSLASLQVLDRCSLMLVA